MKSYFVIFSIAALLLSKGMASASVAIVSQPGSLKCVSNAPSRWMGSLSVKITNNCTYPTSVTVCFIGVETCNGGNHRSGEVFNYAPLSNKAATDIRVWSCRLGEECGPEATKKSKDRSASKPTAKSFGKHRVYNVHATRLYRHSSGLEQVNHLEFGIELTDTRVSLIGPYGFSVPRNGTEDIKRPTSEIVDKWNYSKCTGNVISGLIEIKCIDSFDETSKDSPIICTLNSEYNFTLKVDADGKCTDANANQQTDSYCRGGRINDKDKATFKTVSATCK